MSWLALTYSLPSKGSSNPRVTVWRRLQRLGAVQLAGGIYLLPDQPDFLESFQWFVQEIEHAQGEALVMRVGTLEGVSDGEVRAHFSAARRPEYEELNGQLNALLSTLPDNPTQETRLETLSILKKLRKRHAEVSKRDFFGAPEGGAVAAKLAQLGARLSLGSTPTETVEPVALEDFGGKVWVTRPRPFVDRLASVWLIRRFIDAEAVVRYREVPEAGEISFDMPEARFNHVGNLCTLEVLIASFSLSALGLRALAEIVHDLDLQDGLYARPETAGLEAVLAGWRYLPLGNDELEARGIVLFEGLYQSLVAGEVAATARQAVHQTRS